MTNLQLSGSKKALLAEYKRVVYELIQVLQPLTKEQITTQVDFETKDPDCISIQSVMTHTVSAGYSYAVYIENSIGVPSVRPTRQSFDAASQYIDHLHAMVQYTENVFLQNPNIIIEEKENTKKILTRWSQSYDIEQLMEHAIVHIMRHRRQIEGFIEKLNSK